MTKIELYYSQETNSFAALAPTLGLRADGRTADLAASHLAWAIRDQEAAKAVDDEVKENGFRIAVDEIASKQAGVVLKKRR